MNRRWWLYLGPLLIAGCSSLERAWYLCDSDVWHGWEFEQRCAELAAKGDSHVH